jgi:hypothetical protein
MKSTRCANLQHLRRFSYRYGLFSWSMIDDREGLDLLRVLHCNNYGALPTVHDYAIYAYGSLATCPSYFSEYKYQYRMTLHDMNETQTWLARFLRIYCRLQTVTGTLHTSLIYRSNQISCYNWDVASAYVWDVNTLCEYERPHRDNTVAITRPHSCRSGVNTGSSLIPPRLRQSTLLAITKSFRSAAGTKG